MNGPLLLEVRDLTVRLSRDGHEVTALDRISLSMKAGEVLGVVGESGAGKSLTGAAIIDLLVPPLRRTGGEIRLAGARIDSLPPQEIRRIRGGRIGSVFQDPMTSLNPVIPIGRQLTDTIRAHHGVSRDEARRRAASWLDRVGLPNPEQTLDRYPHELSGGMRQRVVIALALCADPILIIADEPTTALDVSVQAHILQLLKDIQATTAIGMMLITHDLGVIAKMTDRVAVFYAGRIVETGPVERIFTMPRHPYTEGLMRATPDAAADAGRGLEPIPGAMPGLGAAPAGCAFHPRCPRVRERCRTEPPPLVAEGPVSHACWFPLEGAAS